MTFKLNNDKVFEAALALILNGSSRANAVEIARQLVTDVYNGPEEKCLGEGCDRKVRPSNSVDGLCWACYNKMCALGREMEALQGTITQCYFGGCDQRTVQGGYYCAEHQKQKPNQSCENPKHRVDMPWPMCSIGGCKGTAIYGSVFCYEHSELK